METPVAQQLVTACRDGFDCSIPWSQPVVPPSASLAVASAVAAILLYLWHESGRPGPPAGPKGRS